MSWQDEEHARQAARLRRQAEWDEQHSRERALAPQWPETEWPDPAGFGDAPPPRRPDVVAGIPPESGQPAAVLLAAHLARRSDPAAVREESRAVRADRLAQADLAGGTVRLDGREALRMLGVAGNPDGTRLAGSRAREIIRQLGIAGVGHEPGCAP